MGSFWVTENYDFERSCMITCALSGVVANREQCPAIPYSPEEYAAEAKRAYEAGAAAVHIHARKPDGSPSYEVADYRNIYETVTAACPIIINFSTGAVGVPLEKKIAPVTEIKPAIAALNMGSMNYAKYHPKKKSFVFDFVFQNPFSEIVPLVKAMQEAGVKPEMECFDSGHVGNIFPLLDMGLLDPPLPGEPDLGGAGRHTAHGPEPGPPGANPAAEQRLGGDRHQPGSMADGGGSHLPGRQRAGGPGG
jgi:3-keto-5-aminohexanoate cleavage enzyme